MRKGKCRRRRVSRGGEGNFSLIRLGNSRPAIVERESLNFGHKGVKRENPFGGGIDGDSKDEGKDLPHPWWVGDGVIYRCEEIFFTV